MSLALKGELDKAVTEEDVAKAVSAVMSANKAAVQEFKNTPDQRHNHAALVKHFQSDYTAYLESQAF